METLSIKKEAAIAAHENAKSSGKKLLEDLLGKNLFFKDVKDRIKTPEDAIEELGESDPEVISLRKLEEAGITNHIYNNQLAVVIVKALNEGWEPDWDDSNQRKYSIWFAMSSSGFRYDHCGAWLTRSLVGSRLCFKNSGLAIYAGKQFTEVFKKAMLILK